jgi:uncharacterized protein YxeA
MKKILLGRLAFIMIILIVRYYIKGDTSNRKESYFKVNFPEQKKDIDIVQEKEEGFTGGLITEYTQEEKTEAELFEKFIDKTPVETENFTIIYNGKTFKFEITFKQDVTNKYREKLLNDWLKQNDLTELNRKYIIYK